MKYKGCEIVKVKADLGEEDARKNCIYEIYKDGKKKANALTLGTAKEYIASGFNENYL
jgi:hypothetical protein